MMERYVPLVVAVLLCALCWLLSMPLLLPLVALAAAVTWAISPAFEGEAIEARVSAPPPAPVAAKEGELLATSLVSAYEELSKHSFAGSHCILVVGNRGVGKTSAIEAFWDESERQPFFTENTYGLSAYWNSTLRGLVVEVPSKILGLSSVDRAWREFGQELLRLRGGSPITGVIVLVDAEKHRQLQLDEFSKLAGALGSVVTKGSRLPVWLVFTRCDRVQSFYDGGRVLLDRVKVHHLGVLPNDRGVMDFARFRATVWQAAVRSLKGPQTLTTEAQRVMYLCGQLEHLAPDQGISAANAFTHPPLRLQGIWYGCADHSGATEGATTDFVADEWSKDLFKGTAKVQSEGDGPLFFRNLFMGIDPADPIERRGEVAMAAQPGWWTPPRSNALLRAGVVSCLAAFLLSLAAIVANRIELSTIESELRRAVGPSAARPGLRIELERERIERLGLQLSRLRSWQRGDLPLVLRLFDATAATYAPMRALFVRRFTDAVARPIVARTEIELGQCAPRRILSEDDCRSVAARYLMLTGPRELGEVSPDSIPAENIQATCAGWQDLYRPSGYAANRSGAETRLRNLVTLYLQVANDEELVSRDSARMQAAHSLLTTP